MKPTILVTGGTGFIGTYVVDTLLARNYSVVILTRKNARVRQAVRPHLHIFQGDITSKKTLVRALDGCSAVIHLAVNKYDPTLAQKVNVLGAQTLVNAMKIQGITRLINISTQSSKIAHKGIYARTKAASDNIIAQSSLEFTTLRLSLIYGNSPTGLFTMITRYVRVFPCIPIIGSGNWRLNPLHVEDVAEIIVRTLETSGTKRQTYDVGSQTSVSFNLFIKKIMLVMGKSKPILHVPFRLGFIAVSIAQRLHSNFPITPDYILGSNQHTDLKPKPLLIQVKYSPRTLTRGLADLKKSAKKFRVSIIGMGKMGILHAAILTQLSKRYPIELAGFVDTNTRLVSTLRSMGLQGAFYPTVDALLQQKAPDIAFVTSPTFTHGTMVKMLLARDIHTFVEKPLATTYKEAALLLDLSKRASVTTGIGYFFSFRPTFRRFLDLMGNLSSKTHHVRVDVAHAEVFGPKKGWLFSPKLSGGGVLMNPASHALSLLVQAFGLPVSISGTYRSLYSQDVEDELTATLRYRNGLTVEFHASWSVASLPIAQTTVTAHGSYGIIRASGDVITTQFFHTLPKLHIAKGNKTIEETHLIPQGKNPFILQKQTGGIGYYLQDEAFLLAVMQKGRYINNFALACDTEKLIHTIYTMCKKAS